jgi:hypothetical protein
MATELHNSIVDQMTRQVAPEDLQYYPSGGLIDSAARVTSCGQASVHSLAPAASDQILKAAQALLTSQNEDYRVLAFIGAQPGLESRTLCMQVAEVLATTYNFKVSVLDAETDGATPTELGWNVAGGPTKDAAQTPIVASRTATELWVVDRRKVRTSLLDVGPETLRLRIDELRTVFDYVLICAQILEQNRGATIAGYVDGVVIVVEAGRVRKQTLGQIQRTLKYANGRLIGTVMTKRVFPVPGWIMRLFRL